MMKMYFHTDIGDDVILLEKWKPSNGKEMALACVASLILTIIYESLKVFRAYINRRSCDCNVVNNYKNMYHIFESLLVGVQYFISYCLMLIVMTYQIYLIISIVIGGAVGYFIFSPFIAKFEKETTSFDLNDPCCG